MKPDNYPTKKQVMTDPLLRKGHVHRQSYAEPDVCPACGGTGFFVGDNDEEECRTCQGTGEVYN